MPKMNIRRSIEINAPREKVYKTLNDFHHWSAWSPWLMAEPEAKVDVREDGKYYKWDGNRVGSGEMTLVGESPNKIDYDLTFLKPWKSKSQVKFLLDENNDQTNVTWTMDSSLPFFMFWMKKSMEAFVGFDYERGLNMLKEYIEKGNINSKLDFKGKSEFPGCKYIGISRTTTIPQVGKAMETDFGKIWEFMGDKHNNIGGSPFSIYHKWDMVKKNVEYTSGVPVKEVPSELPNGFISGSMPNGSIYTIRHIGAYQHLGNAWSTLYSMQRNKELKPVKGRHPFESYANNPGEVDEKDLITDINFFVK